ncbi:polysaccharide deacetylase family protein [Candidatus Saccharibacteria bacterium]|nr:polysaccharide deacetylase family protein [Candidatus Saccharibacteria bacterium]
MVMLSLDVEEFDLPREHGGKITVEQGAEVSAVGLRRVLEMLERTGVKATMFVTGNFATEKPELVQEMMQRGHEIGCHGVEHFEPKAGDATRGKEMLEKMLGKGRVIGYRQPRMFPISYPELKAAGYLYDTSVNPAFIPGRYNHLDAPRRAYRKDEVWEVPTSVATFMRVPVFWLALHVFPVWVYVILARMSLRATGYMATYFHPWEFGEIRGRDAVPVYIKWNSGEKLVRKLEKVIRRLKGAGYDFVTYGEYVRGLEAKGGRTSGESSGKTARNTSKESSVNNGGKKND